MLHEGRGEREREKGREKMRMGERKREGKREREKEMGKQRTNRETHVESGTNQKDAQGKKGNQPDKTQSEKVPKPRTYDFFPTVRAAFIGM